MQRSQSVICAHLFSKNLTAFLTLSLAYEATTAFDLPACLRRLGSKIALPAPRQGVDQGQC